MPFRFLLLISLVFVAASAHAADPCAQGLKSAVARAELALASGSADAQSTALACILTALKGLEARIATIESDVTAPPRLIVPRTSDANGSAIIVRGNP